MPQVPICLLRFALQCLAQQLLRTICYSRVAESPVRPLQFDSQSAADEPVTGVVFVLQQSVERASFTEYLLCALCDCEVLPIPAPQ